MRKFKWSHLYLLLTFVVLYLPIGYLILYSFSEGERMTNYHGFTWQHYQELFADPRMIQIVLDTLIVALLSALVATIIGTLGALAINNTTRPSVKNTILSLNNILMVSPDVIIGASFLIFFTALRVPWGSCRYCSVTLRFPFPLLC